MQLTHRFTLAAAPEQVWSALSRLDLIAPCFPGATVEGVDGQAYTGSVKIKFGPLPLVYSGTARIITADQTDRRLVVEASAEDLRGHGTARAAVTARLRADGGATDVAVHTDLIMTGRPAQLGDGVVRGVSDRLLDQFTGCLSARLAAGLLDEAEVAETGELGKSPQLSERDVAASSRTYTPPSQSTSAPHLQVLPSVLKQTWPYLAGAVAAAVLLGVLVRRVARRG